MISESYTPRIVDHEHGVIFGDHLVACHDDIGCHAGGKPHQPGGLVSLVIANQVKNFEPIIYKPARRGYLNLDILTLSFIKLGANIFGRYVPADHP